MQGFGVGKAGMEPDTMTGSILIIVLGIVVLAINIHALFKGFFYANLYKVTRKSNPFQFYRLVVLDFIGGIFLIVFGTMTL